MKWPNSLPIDSSLDQIVSDTSKYQNIILQSGPGTGKTTRIPLALMAGLPQNFGKILVLVPRRLAAKMAAMRMAETLGEEVGERVGYAFRFDRKEGPNTKILVLTEGTFLRILNSSPHLLGIGLIILDEFHERHTQTDLAFILISHLQKKARPDLKLMMMSATINYEKFLCSGPLTKNIIISNRSYNVVINYLPHRPEYLKLDITKKIFYILDDALKEVGDILIFLPGMREILNLKKYLEDKNISDTVIHHLHGDLPKEEQMLVMKKNTSNKRKIILATNIAESSITIPGVSLVIDAGLKRELVFSPWSGLSTLETKKISQFSAIQRAGRAGREQEGVCYRLYSEMEFRQMPESDIPEILRADLSMEILTLIKHKMHLDQIDWIDFPGENNISHAILVLKMLGAIRSCADQYEMTEIGEKILKYPTAVRLSRVFVEMEQRSPQNMTKILQEIFHSVGENDFRQQEIVKKILMKEKSILNGEASSAENFPSAFYLMFGFIDRFARLRKDHKDFILKNGECLKISHQIDISVEDSSFWLILETGPKKEVISCVSIEEDWIYEFDSDLFSEKEICEWNSNKGKMEIKRTLNFGQIILEEERISYEKWSAQQIVSNKEQIILIRKKLLQKSWDAFLLSNEYFRIFLVFKDLKLEQNISLDFIFQENDFLELEVKESDKENYELYSERLILKLTEIRPEFDSYKINNLYPKFIKLKYKQTSKELEVTYHKDQQPSVEGFIQDFYGRSELPTIGILQLKLVVILIGPHKRPLQVTCDLKNFWCKTYKEMLRELSRDYPRHHWPIDPTDAEPVLLKKWLNKN